MALIINLLMVLVAAALIGYPLMAKHRQNYAYEGQETEVDNKELLFSALGEIEFDYRMKKLSDEDYQQLKAGYQSRALAVLDQEEEQLEEELEKALSRGKKSKSRVKPEVPDHE